MRTWVPEWATHYTIEQTTLGCTDSIIIEFYSTHIDPADPQPLEDLEKDLAIRDVLQQIRNTPLPKQDRYKSDPTDAEDYIDKTYKSMPWQEFVGAIKWTIGKYFDRFGKKDDILKEAIKIEDYAIRFRQKVELEIAKQNKINEVV